MQRCRQTFHELQCLQWARRIIRERALRLRRISRRHFKHRRRYCRLERHDRDHATIAREPESNEIGIRVAPGREDVAKVLTLPTPATGISETKFELPGHQRS